MRRFLSDIKNAVAGASFIDNVRERTFGDGAWFIVKLAVIQSLVLAAIVLIQIVPILIAFSERDLIGEYYPEELVVTIADGVVSTNVEEPYLISVGDVSEDEEMFTHAFVIDTKVENPLDALVAYDTFALLTDDSLLLQEESGEIRAFSLKEVGDMTVSKESVAAFANDIMPIVYVAGIVAGIFAFGCIIVFSALYYLALAVLLALFVWMVSLVRGMKLSYGQSYVVSVYALALPILIDTALDIFSMTSRFVFVLGIFALVILVHAARYETTKEGQGAIHE